MNLKVEMGHFGSKRMFFAADAEFLLPVSLSRVSKWGTSVEGHR